MGLQEIVFLREMLQLLFHFHLVESVILTDFLGVALQFLALLLDDSFLLVDVFSL
jgi:hypothetical protein